MEGEDMARSYIQTRDVVRGCADETACYGRSWAVGEKTSKKKKGQSRSTRLLGGSTFYGTNVSWSKGVGARTNAWVPVCRVGMEVPWLYLAVLGRDGSGATPGDLIFFF